jgi:hypothetical protein
MNVMKDRLPLLPQNQVFSLKQIIHRALKCQEAIFQDEVWPSNSILSKRQESWHIRLERQIDTWCEKCRWPRSDAASRWAVMRPGHYVANKYICPSKDCGRKRRYFIPRNPDISWVRGNTDTLERPNIRIKPELSCLRSVEDTTLNLPSVVISLCIRWRNDTRIYCGGNQCINSHPRWTLGFTRPLYLERKPHCYRCKEKRQAQGRFVPVDPTIPSFLPTF